MAEEAATSGTRARRGRRKCHEEDERPWQAGGAMEREEGDDLGGDVGRRALGRRGTTEHGHVFGKTVQNSTLPETVVFH